MEADKEETAVKAEPKAVLSNEEIESRINAILGLSDVIVDIVETGTTLRENGLRVVTEFMPISARTKRRQLHRQDKLRAG